MIMKIFVTLIILALGNAALGISTIDNKPIQRVLIFTATILGISLVVTGITLVWMI